MAPGAARMQRQRGTTAALVLVALGVAFGHDDHSTGVAQCPGSPASNHAWLAMEALVSTTCESTQEEILARVAGQAAGSWDDPHGNGLYSLQSNVSGEIRVDRRSSNGNYKDFVLLRFSANGDGCRVGACSESQGGSWADQSTNLCNAWNLLCGLNEQCCSVRFEVTAFSYTIISKSSGAGNDVGVCLGGQGGSGGGFGGERQTTCPEVSSKASSGSSSAAPVEDAGDVTTTSSAGDVTTTSTDSVSIAASAGMPSLVSLWGAVLWITLV